MRSLPVCLYLAATVALLGQEGGPPASGALSDAAARGKAVFEGKGACLDCHRVLDRGSRFGPDLTDIGARAGVGQMFRGGRPGRAEERSGSPGGRRGGQPSQTAGRAREELENSLLDPDSEVASNNRMVRVVDQSGSAVTGRLLNQDTFTVQLMDPQERLLSFSKADLREFSFIRKSSMPSYRGKLTPGELDDLIAYLLSLKGVKP